jgi:ABC-type glycerol-3-phosphate transport system substrate-binding protein
MRRKRSADRRAANQREGITAGIGAGSKSPDAAKELLKFLTGPDAAARSKAKGFEPG